MIPRLQECDLLLTMILHETRCLNWRMVAVNLVLTFVDAIISFVAFIQLLRLYLRARHGGCSREKVFHFLVGASNLGYLVYFLLTPIAKCHGWTCWSHACGFIVMALPQILFLATFLLLLSFWVDLCNQATDRVDDEEEEDENDYTTLPSSIQPLPPPPVLANHGRRRRCCPWWWRHRIRWRQKFVIVVVALFCILTIAFALLIWIGTGRNPINSSVLAQVYSDIFAIIMLLSGGGLAGYGLLLYHKIRRVRSGRALGDIKKVAGLAAVSVCCFSIQAFIVLFTDMPALDIWRRGRIDRDPSPFLIFLNYFIGESVPSIVVLWVMREFPGRPSESGHARVILAAENIIVPERSLIRQIAPPERKEMSHSPSSSGGRSASPKVQVRRENPSR